MFLSSEVNNRFNSLFFFASNFNQWKRRNRYFPNITLLRVWPKWPKYTLSEFTVRTTIKPLPIASTNNLWCIISPVCLSHNTVTWELLDRHRCTCMESLYQLGYIHMNATSVSSNLRYFNLRTLLLWKTHTHSLTITFNIQHDNYAVQALRFFTCQNAVIMSTAVQWTSAFCSTILFKFLIKLYFSKLFFFWFIS